MDKAIITGVILAGGQARRMGGEDKGLLSFTGQPMIEHIISALHPQVNGLLINANRNIERYQQYGYPVIEDTLCGYQGPLAGMVSCMAAVKTDYMLTLPCDSPCLPGDLVARLAQCLEEENADICTAHNGERMQAVFSLMPISLRHSLAGFLESGGRKIETWFAQHTLAVADFADKPETFFNMNTPEDIAALESRIDG